MTTFTRRLILGTTLGLAQLPLTAGYFTFDIDTTLNSGTDLGITGIRSTFDYAEFVPSYVTYNDGDGKVGELEFLFDVEFEIETTSGTSLVTWNYDQLDTSFELSEINQVAYSNDTDPLPNLPANSDLFDGDFIWLEVTQLKTTIGGTEYGMVLAVAGAMDIPGSEVPDEYMDLPDVKDAPVRGEGEFGNISTMIIYSLPTPYFNAQGWYGGTLSETEVARYDLSGTVSHSVNTIPEPSAIVGLPIILGLATLRRHRR